MNRTAAVHIAYMGYSAQDMLLEVQFHQDGGGTATWRCRRNFGTA